MLRMKSDIFVFTTLEKNTKLLFYVLTKTIAMRAGDL